MAEIWRLAGVIEMALKGNNDGNVSDEDVETFAKDICTFFQALADWTSKVDEKGNRVADGSTIYKFELDSLSLNSEHFDPLITLLGMLVDKSGGVQIYRDTQHVLREAKEFFANWPAPPRPPPPPSELARERDLASFGQARSYFGMQQPALAG